MSPTQNESKRNDELKNELLKIAQDLEYDWTKVKKNNVFSIVIFQGWLNVFLYNDSLKPLIYTTF